MNATEELLKRTGKFEDKDLKQSAEIVEAFVGAVRAVAEMPGISEMLGMKK